MTKLKLPSDFFGVLLKWPIIAYDSAEASGDDMYKGELAMVILIIGSLAFRLGQFDDATGLAVMYATVGASLSVAGPWLAKMNDVAWDPKE